ncbi:putative quinol monooxygenase [Streptomyces sp. NPDC054787]
MVNDPSPDSARLGLHIRLEAKPEHAKAVEELLTGALALAQEEEFTTAWFALRLGPTTFGIFDVFGNEEDRTAHLRGTIAAALLQQAPHLLAAAPEILPVDVLAAKLAWSPRP